MLLASKNRPAVHCHGKARKLRVKRWAMIEVVELTELLNVMLYGLMSRSPPFYLYDGLYLLETPYHRRLRITNSNWWSTKKSQKQRIHSRYLAFRHPCSVLTTKKKPCI